MDIDQQIDRRVGQVWKIAVAKSAISSAIPLAEYRHRRALMGLLSAMSAMHRGRVAEIVSLQARKAVGARK